MTSKPKVGFLGPLGTYSHEAALRSFADTDYILEPQITIPDCMTSLLNMETDYAILPFENSTNGSVVYTLDVLRSLYHHGNEESPKTFKTSAENYELVGEVFVPISHCLISEVSDFSKISRIYSHPQVWGQCDKWTNEYFRGVEKVDTTSTSKAVELAKGDPTAAAIAGRAAASLHQVPVQAESINNKANNTTRFLIFGKKHDDKHYDENSLSYNTLISYTIEHSIPGALCQALSAFGRRSVNLTQITTRPSGQTPWTYVFFLEFQGHLQNDNVKLAIEELSHYCLELNLLGSFKRAVKQND